MRLNRRTMLKATLAAAIGLLSVVGMGQQAQASHINVAVFGDNGFDNYINSLGPYTAVLVSDAQLATPGFLNSFSAVVMTRNGFSFGNGLSAAAAAQVSAWVGPHTAPVGNVVLFNGDFADSLPGFGGDASVQQLVANAVAFAVAAGHGFIGEFNGAVSGLTSNANGFNPLNLIPGAAGVLGFGNGGSAGDLFLAPAGVGHPVTTGVGFPFTTVPC